MASFGKIDPRIVKGRLLRRSEEEEPRSPTNGASIG
jgi:hypothetical protein